MRDDNLSSMLDGLRSGDVAPEWRKENAWQKIDARLLQPYEVKLQFWVYPAAAAALLLWLFLMPSHKSVLIVHQFEQRAPEPVQSAETITDIRPLVVRGSRKRAVAIKSVTATWANIQTPISTTADTITAVASTITNAPAQLRKGPFIKREPEVVYTLNEIMADVPEREAPPKKYSSIFRSRNTTETTPSPSYRRKSAMDEQTPEIPNIIN